MKDYKIELASRDDDEHIRECLRKNAMSGEISITFETEPSYFDALSVQGKENKVIIGKTNDGKMMGFGSITVKPVHINGDIFNIGYLSGLRVNKEFRRNIFLLKGYQLFRDIDPSLNVPFYLTTIIEDNLEARKILESGRAGMPQYNFLGTLSTFLVKPRERSSKININIVRGNEVSLEGIVKFMNQEGSKKQFYPYIEEKDFGSDYLRDLSQEDFYVALNEKEIIGLAAKWDQESFKQTRIVGYNKTMRFARPFINLASRFTNVPRLPSERELLHYFYVSFPTTKDNNPEIMESLLSKITSDPENRHYDYFTIGTMENDSLNQVIRTFNPREYRSKLYLVSFDKNPEDLRFLNERVPYLELGSL
jgi:hypothetical protein